LGLSAIGFLLLRGPEGFLTLDAGREDIARLLWKLIKTGLFARRARNILGPFEISRPQGRDIFKKCVVLPDADAVLPAVADLLEVSRVAAGRNSKSERYI
jgi:hypothetical protein